MRIPSATLVATLVLLLAGCSATVSQAPVAPKELGFRAEPLKVPGGYVIDSDYRAYYNGLIKVYGDHRLANKAPVFVPALTWDDLLTQTDGSHWFMPDRARENMVVMERLQRRGAK